MFSGYQNYDRTYGQNTWKGEKDSMMGSKWAVDDIAMMRIVLNRVIEDEGRLLVVAILNGWLAMLSENLLHLSGALLTVVDPGN